MKVFLAQPRGFCAGVDRAIEIVERALLMFGAPVFVRHEIVHNRHVVALLKKKGAKFIDEVDDVPDDALLIFSAHGVSRGVRKTALSRGLHIIDATCPLVTKVHLELVRHAKLGRQIILIGHAGHPEVEGTMGQAEAGVVLLVSTVEDVHKLRVQNEQKLAYVTQTTLSIDDTRDIIAALRQCFPDIQIPKREDICYATSNRQMAVKQLAKQCQIVLVIGSQNSSNSQRLCETAKRDGATSWLIDEASEIQKSWLDGVSCVGVTAGASAPETLVKDVVAHLQTLGASGIELSSSMEENIVFRLPAELQ